MVEQSAEEAVEGVPSTSLDWQEVRSEEPWGQPGKG